MNAADRKAQKLALDVRALAERAQGLRTESLLDELDKIFIKHQIDIPPSGVPRNRPAVRTAALPEPVVIEYRAAFGDSRIPTYSVPLGIQSEAYAVEMAQLMPQAIVFAWYGDDN